VFRFNRTTLDILCKEAFIIFIQPYYDELSVLNNGKTFILVDILFSSMASSTTTSNNQSNTLNNETAVYEYMRQFVDYQENGIDLNELSQIRQLDIYLQSILLIFFMHIY